MKKIFILSLLCCLQHNPLNAMKRPRTELVIAQKCPRQEYLSIKDLESPTKKQKKQCDDIDKTQPNTIKAMKSPRAEFAQLATVQKMVKKQILKREDFEPETKHICNQCNKNFTRTYDLIIHKNTVHSNERPYDCDKCNANFKRKGDLNQHTRTTHSNERPYPCDKCDRCFKNKGNRDLHIARCHSKIIFTCSICPATFKSCNHLTRHEDSVHATTRQYKCDQEKCDKSFKTKAELTQHRRRHVNEKSHSCECGKDFITKAELDQHKVVHAEKSYLCEQCGKYFTFKRSISRHQKKSCPGKPEIS